MSQRNEVNDNVDGIDAEGAGLGCADGPVGGTVDGSVDSSVDGTAEGAPVLESALLDVSDLDLAMLGALPDSVLRESLRRVFAESQETPDQYAAFQSSM